MSSDSHIIVHTNFVGDYEEAESILNHIHKRGRLLTLIECEGGEARLRVTSEGTISSIVTGLSVEEQCHWAHSHTHAKVIHLAIIRSLLRRGNRFP
jgi:hypothetical protein